MPQPVSPLIRGARWGLFILGIIYARGKQRLYNAIEASYQESERQRKTQHDKEMAVVRARVAKEEQEAIRKIETGEMFK